MKNAIAILRKELDAYKAIYFAMVEYYIDEPSTKQIKAKLKKALDDVLEIEQAIKTLQKYNKK